VIDADTFRSVLGRFASGVTIVTARAANVDHGMTVSAFCSVSLDPPLVLVCIDHVASMHALLLSYPVFGVSILSLDHEASARRFADADELERFDGLAYTRGESGVVLLEGALAHLECRVVQHFDAGDHTVFVAAVETAQPRHGRPLLYYRGGYAQLER
jgi:flavin reductase (DIM6/NTAB) family NADH-FMN oxidoreductase RutF